MDINRETERCLKLIAHRYQNGATGVTPEDLFPDTKRTDDENVAVLRLLETKGAISAIWVINKKLPSALSILPKSIELAAEIKQWWHFDSMMAWCKSHWSISILAITTIALATIIPIVQAVWPKTGTRSEPENPPILKNTPEPNKHP